LPIISGTFARAMGQSSIDYPQGQNGLPVLQAMNITTHLGEAFLTKQQLGRCKSKK